MAAERDIRNIETASGKTVIGLLPKEEIALSDEIERTYITREQHEEEVKAIVEAQTNGRGVGNHSPHHIMKTYAAFNGMPMCDKESITKWLDRWFVKRPRFEDGEPVQFGDEFVADLCHGEEVVLDANYMVVALDGSCAYLLTDYDGYMEDDAYRFKRPAPKVLDADGVEIKVGDTVYEGDGAVPLKVVRLCKNGDIEAIGDGGLCSKLDSSSYTHERPVFDADGERIKVGDTVWRTEDGLKMKVRAVGKEALEKHGCSVATLLPDDDWDDYGLLHYSGEELTHREPDSLEKLRNEMLVATKVNQTVESAKHDIEIFADRLTAIIERGA